MHKKKHKSAPSMISGPDNLKEESQNYSTCEEKGSSMIFSRWQILIWHNLLSPSSLVESAKGVDGLGEAHPIRHGHVSMVYLNGKDWERLGHGRSNR